MSSTTSASTSSFNHSAFGYHSHHYNTMDSNPIVSIEVLRCMRCAREVEITTTDDISSTGMVEISTNLYYCSRCAKATGYAWWASLWTQLGRARWRCSLDVQRFFLPTIATTHITVSVLDLMFSQLLRYYISTQSAYISTNSDTLKCSDGRTVLHGMDIRSRDGTRGKLDLY